MVVLDSATGEVRALVGSADYFDPAAHGQINIVTTPRSDIMYVVTEYGMTNLKGKSVADRVRALIPLAHPDFREGLEREAYEHRLVPRWCSSSK